jgi:hypothetical protein
MQYHSGNFLTARHMYMCVYVCACVRVCIYTIRNTICTIYFNIKETQNYVRRLNLCVHAIPWRNSIYFPKTAPTAIFVMGTKGKKLVLKCYVN